VSRFKIINVGAKILYNLISPIRLPKMLRLTHALSRHLILFVVPLVFFGQSKEGFSKPPRLDVPFVTTPLDVVDTMLDLAAVGPDDHLVDLGSGDGRIVLAAVKKYGATAHGVDLDANLVAKSQKASTKAGLNKRATFSKQNLFEADFSKASVITMYLLPSVNLELRPKLLNLKAGTRIVSHMFDMGDWTPDQHIRAGIGGTNDVYLWVVPAKVDGAWPLYAPGLSRPVRVTLRQTFQKINGTAKVGQKNVALSNAGLEGDRIWFDFEGARRLNPSHVNRFEGRIIDGVLRGFLSDPKDKL
jgi:hypothetical protein